MSKKMNTVFDEWKKIKNEVTKKAKDGNLNIKEVQHLIQKVVKQAEGDIKGLVDHDVKKVMSRLKTERKALEKMVDDVLQAEMKKAKTFLNSYKKQLKGMQKTVEKTLKNKVKVKVVKKKVTKKKSATPRKKATKKAVVETTTTSK
ncbi:MAG: hypothetical protein COW00_16725 [Bdellovibrio sp. CG12_big_fil_rev_8_21_14_0_65_39_13]|nr:MAG: hypothetical protein COW78_10015 [Bdellovibrio sp. CG22_combo_CG10-13_8_21_14_all_39_27]PIQ58249.1 MAG: hypothetical protein COW00_16725 [Bdellovibrio sp. CG12_big_fil_rev_8_21_14_0_65_39_13]PIR36658.1 MAG: hypothetical protein COV37_02245 [Bdellovibrio sp. CG11_big_fil_rev_8_21_14_0_20_39_38]PJB53372.1 MAG: hypothetical protein CO099_07395 [Bdellovibrio sp. CG_4_9_14_3_um_filter_39_7]